MRSSALVIILGLVGRDVTRIAAGTIIIGNSRPGFLLFVAATSSARQALGSARSVNRSIAAL
jgi:hypothetical protein